MESGFSLPVTVECGSCVCSSVKLSFLSNLYTFSFQSYIVKAGVKTLSVSFAKCSTENAEPIDFRGPYKRQISPNHYVSQINSLPFNGYEMVCFVLHLYWIIMHFSWQYLLARQSLAFFCFSNVCTQLPPSNASDFKGPRLANE